MKILIPPKWMNFSSSLFKLLKVTQKLERHYIIIKWSICGEPLMCIKIHQDFNGSHKYAQYYFTLLL